MWRMIEDALRQSEGKESGECHITKEAVTNRETRPSRKGKGKVPTERSKWWGKWLQLIA